MPRIIALSGISGSGKTYTREHDPNLKDLPYIDIADIYAAEPPGLSNRLALALLLDRLEAMVEEGQETIVLEAYFRRGSSQRAWLEYTAERLGATVEYIELEAPIEICTQRVMQDWEVLKQRSDLPEEELERMARFFSARIQILEDIAGHGS